MIAVSFRAHAARSLRRCIVRLWPFGSYADYRGDRMETVHFVGRVVPPESAVTIGYTPVIKIEEKALDFNASFVVHIENSFVDVECRLDRYNPDDHAQRVLLYVRAFDMARAAVDLVSFATGTAQTVFFGGFVDPKGVASQLNFHDPNLAAICTAYRVNTPESDTSFNEMYNIVLSDYQLFMALNDLIAANTLPHIGPINCGRVMDALRRLMAPNISNVGTAWGVMQTGLNISRAYREHVTKASANPRHADRSFIPGAVNRDLLCRTWTVFNRYLEFRKRGNKRLSAPEFPLL